MTGFGAAGRHDHIAGLLQAEGRVSVVALAADLRVSVVTVRNDLDHLERQGMLRRMRGGAVAVRGARFERPAHLSGGSYKDEKSRIAAVAASLVRDGETIIIDAGSTMVALAGSLPRTLNDVAVVTNALDVALHLEEHPGLKVVVTGGTVRTRQRSLIAPFATLLLGQVNADVAFLSCAARHLRAEHTAGLHGAPGRIYRDLPGQAHRLIRTVGEQRFHPTSFAGSSALSSSSSG